MPTPTLNPTQPPTARLDLSIPLNPVPAGARSPGIAMYDWLAAVAMQGLVTHGMEVKADRAMTEDDKDDEMAQRAYRMAAAMMRARSEALKELECDRATA